MISCKQYFVKVGNHPMIVLPELINETVVQFKCRALSKIIGPNNITHQPNLSVISKNFRCMFSTTPLQEDQMISEYLIPSEGTISMIVRAVTNYT